MIHYAGQLFALESKNKRGLQEVNTKVSDLDAERKRG